MASAPEGRSRRTTKDIAIAVALGTLVLGGLLGTNAILKSKRDASLAQSLTAKDVAEQGLFQIEGPGSTLQPEVRAVLALLGLGLGEQEEAIAYISEHWTPELTPMLLDALTLVRQSIYSREAIAILEQRTGQKHGFDIQAWYQWVWNQPVAEHPEYGEFKSALFGLIDPRFYPYFSGDRPRNIRLDEVRWGGVRQDGIPPLRSPEMIAADEANYLEDDHVVFGIAVNGDVRAYPKRILAWHEMFVDTVGDVPVTGVYCTLCGTMILYESEIDGVKHEFGTSGFLYRSNKLMYDKATQSLWVTLLGTPAIGPLVEEDIALKHRSVVTTTWGEWRRRHPETTVLSLNTGHRRDYSEGAAYREYFATDDLMFNVPDLDDRLKNKDEILGLLFPESSDRPLAISADFLAENPIHHERVGDLDFVVLTDPSGANRVYISNGLKFATYDGDASVEDESGRTWNLTEDALIASDGETLERLPSFRAFWFG
ncbi:MAG: DUF3179 domain-containing protein, partial [Cyanobacteria bacterium J06648_11]